MFQKALAGAARVAPSLMMLALAALPATAATVDPAVFKALHWRSIGPFRGGRALAVTGVSGQPGLFYFGAASGGVWKSIDSGARWTPIFDGQDVATIGAIAVAPSNSKVIYVGTGEGALRGDITWGKGVYKSVDAGKTWMNIGLKDTRQIGAVIVDPANPDIVLVAAIGHAFGPNAERGVFRSTDGGRTWTKTLFKNPDTGAIDVTFDPSTPKIVYAALYQVRRQPWNMSSGGPGSGLYRSTDEGATWTKLDGHGLPSGILGRIDVAVSGADSNRVYAMIEAADGGLYRSDDAGANWRRINADGRLTQRAWYFSKIWADPKSVDTVFALNTGMLKSTDGGKTFGLVSATHGDHHGLWIDPADPNRMINGNDGGASVSLDGGKTWSTQENQPTAAFYHVATDPNRFPYWVYGAQQDNSNLAVASFDDEGVIGPRDFFPAGGGECGFVIPDPRDPLIIYSDSENGVNRFDKRAEQSQDISAFPGDFSGHPASELEHRFNWTSPLLLSPHDPDALYWGADVVYKSTDHGHSWRIISPDLTRNDKSKQYSSGGPLTKDITSVEYYDTVFALAESPLAKGMIWAGSDDGLVHLTADDGGHWRDVTPAAVPAWSSIDLIEPSHFDANTAYIAVDRHKLDDVKPYALRTRDGGRSWQAITAGLPDGAVVHAVREDPVRRGLLFAGTEKGVFVSFDDGGAWQPLQLDLPSVPVHDLAIQGDDLVAATHGRSFWILDNITPLRQVGAAGGGDMVLYTPQAARRLYYPDQVDTRRPVGENPPAGALIDYAFKTAPNGEVTVDILDAQGQLVRHLSSTHSDKVQQPPEWPDQIIPVDTIPAAAGMNRLVWDLRSSDPAQIPGAFYSGPTPRGVLVPPGRYQVRLTYAGQSRTAPLTLLADPRVKDSQEAIAAKAALALAVFRDIDRLHRAVNDIRAARAGLPAGSPQAARMSTIEEKLMQVNMKGSEANLAFPGMLNEQLATFALGLDDADAPPTEPRLAVYHSLHQQLDEQLAAWDAVKTQLR